MRCIIKTLKSKFLPIFLIFTITFGFLVSGSFAYSSGTFSTPEEIVSLSGNGAGAQAAALLLWKNYGYDLGNYYYLFCYNSSEVLCLSCNCEFAYYNKKLYAKEPGAVFHTNFISRSGRDTGIVTDTASASPSTFGDDIWYSCNFANSVYGWFYFRDGVSWTNFTYYDLTNGNIISDHNLDASSYLPDPRQVFCELSYLDSDTYGELPYIYVSTTDTVDFLNSYCYFEFTDSRGSGQTVTVLSSQYINPHIVDSDYSSWIFSPTLISSYDFHLDSLTYYSLDFGSKTIELDIDVVYGEEYPLPDNYDYIYYFNNYFESHSNGALAYGVTYLGLTTFLSDGVTTVNWVDMDSRLTCQNFEVKALFIPDFMTDDVLSMEQIYQLYEQYDVIFANVTQVFYNLLVGGNGNPYLSLKDLYDNYGFDSALNGLIHTKFDCHSLPFEYLDLSNFSFTVQLTPPCLFIVTRSFLLKRTLSALGDIDDRLLEFETALLGEDGLGVSLQNKLDNLFVQQNEYFTDISNFIRKLNYWLNDNPLSRIEGYLHDIWEATVGEFCFDYSLLPEPFESLFQYALGFFASSYSFLQDFKDVSDSSLYGDDLINLPFSYTPTIIPIPLEPLSPTPIPLPTLIGGD